MSKLAATAKHGKPSEEFFAAAGAIAFDREHRRKINFNMGRYDAAVAKGRTLFADLPLAKSRAAQIKWKVLEHLDTYLLQFEAAFTARGGKVIWAATAEDAVREILAIASRAQAKTAVKSKSMTTEEIELGEALEHAGIESLETDLGEYIVQLAGEKPYHIVTPAMHKSKEDIALLFHEKLGTPLNFTPEELTNKAREILRQKYVDADLGITGANFLLAAEGAIAITENEGNGRLTATFPKIHIALAGIEKVLPSIADLDLFWPLLATHGTGQLMTVYNSLFFGPRQKEETDGPEEMYVILLDNGRTELLGQPSHRHALGCIRCGACLNACPVYKNVGGHTYGTPYSGPIGSVITPHLKGMENWKHLSHASSLCGACSEVCPVKIEIHKLLLLNRQLGAQQASTTGMEKLTWMVWKRAMLSRKLMNTGGAGVKNIILKKFFGRAWGAKRALPQIAPKGFARLLAEYREGKK